MRVMKLLYLPIRRIWLEDNEVPHESDIPWLIGMPLIIVVNLVVCFFATLSN